MSPTDLEEIIDAVLESERYAPKLTFMGVQSPIYEGMHPDLDGPWVSRVEVAKRLREALWQNQKWAVLIAALEHYERFHAAQNERPDDDQF